jgi:type II secretory pathway pseudopilin PulG
MAIVLLIMSLVASAMLSFGIKETANSRRELTQTRMDVIETAIADFMLRNGRLPCPAEGFLAPTTAGYGVENCVNTLIAAQTIHVGTVPITTIGISDELMLDGWDKRFTYAVDSALVGAQAFFTTNPTAPPQGQISVLVSGGAPGTTRTTTGAVVLMSAGDNGWGAWSQQPASTDRLIPDATTLATMGAGELENAHVSPYTAGTPLNFDRNFTQEARSATFDDVVRFMDRNQIIQKAGGIVDRDYCQMVFNALQPTNPNVTPKLGPISCVSTIDRISMDLRCEQRQRQMASVLGQLCGLR